ncbi:hypothetical protein ACDN41_11890 [Priestia aryabhattai]|uniref:hypothetical protein n=1 Tax=Priestia aryabhattai TaxID=412384 RepID=UPI0035321F26
MGIFGLDKVKMFFKGNDGAAHEVEAETAEVVYKPEESKFEIDKINELHRTKGYTFELENVEIAPDFVKWIDETTDHTNKRITVRFEQRKREIDKQTKKLLHIQRRTKNKRIKNKINKKLHSLQNK